MMPPSLYARSRSTWGGRCAALLGALALSGAAWSQAWPQAEPLDNRLPQRNLLIEWRVSSQGQSRERTAGLQHGRVIIDSQRGVIGGAQVRLGTVQTDSQSDTVQQLRVLNGGRARLYMGQSRPYTVWQWAGGQPGQVWAQTQWLDLGQGMSLRPRWPGGRAPVTVELEARGSQAAPYEPDGQTRQSEVASTLSVSLGEWAVVARSGSRAQQQRAGTLSTRDLDDAQSEQLEIRVTAP